MNLTEILEEMLDKCNCNDCVKLVAEAQAKIEALLPEKKDLSTWDSYPDKTKRKFHRYIEGKTHNDTIDTIKKRFKGE